MSFEISDRLSGLFEGVATLTPPVGRTAAQRKASRRNGARSHGPRTTAGKRRSAMNALKHGLLATPIAPPDDRRGDQGLYSSVRAELFAEYTPTRFSDAALLESLAADYVDLARARRLIEASHVPPALPPDEVQRMALVTNTQREHGVLQRISDALNGGEWPAPANDIATGAGLLSRAVVAIEEALAPSDPNDPHGLLPLPEEEARPLRDILDKLGPRQREWSRADAVELLLRRRKMGGEDLARLRVLLGHAMMRRTSLLRGYETLIDFVAARDSHALQQMAQDPGRLVLLRRYLSPIEHSIDRKIRRLRGR